MLVEMIVDSMIVVCSNVREYVSDLSHQRGKQMNVTIGRVDNVMTIMLHCYITTSEREVCITTKRERERLYNRERYYNRDITTEIERKRKRERDYSK